MISNGVLGVQQDGDITDHVCPETDASSKSKVCQQMNMAAKKTRDADLEHSMLLAAAAVLRNCFVLVESVAAAKLDMESSTKSGYTCRIAYTDCTQHHNLISKGVYSRFLCTQPTVKVPAGVWAKDQCIANDINHWDYLEPRWWGDFGEFS